MNEEGSHMQDESEIVDLIKRYERMVETGGSHYFDVEEFEIISHQGHRILQGRAKPSLGV